jgi:hypothetical protein
VHLECSGVLTPTATTKQSLELVENITTDTHENCVREGIVKLIRRGNSLAMTYTRNRRRAKATLHRRSDEKEPQLSKPREDPQRPTAKEAAIQRYEQYLHALGREDIETVCEIAGPAAKQAEDQGFGPCKATFPITFQLISPGKKKALQSATIDSNLVTERTPGRIDVPLAAVKAAVTFSEHELGSATTLEYIDDNWYITD